MNELHVSRMPIVATYSDGSLHEVRAGGGMLVSTTLDEQGEVLEQFAEVLEPLNLLDGLVDWTQHMLTPRYGHVWAANLSAALPSGVQRVVWLDGQVYAADYADGIVLLDAEPEQDSTAVNPHNVRLLADTGHVFGQWSPEPLTADTSEWLEDAVMAEVQADGSVAVALHANIPTNLESSADADAMVRLVLPREVAESIAYLILGR